MPIADVGMMVRREKDSPADELSVKILTFAFMCACFILFKGDVEHGGHSGQFSSHIVFVNHCPKLFQESFTLFPDIFEHIFPLKDFYGLERSNKTFAVWKKG